MSRYRHWYLFLLLCVWTLVCIHVRLCMRACMHACCCEWKNRIHVIVKLELACCVVIWTFRRIRGFIPYPATPVSCLNVWSATWNSCASCIFMFRPDKTGGWVVLWGLRRLIRLGVEYAVRGEVEDGRWTGQSPTGGSQVLLLPQQRLWPTDIWNSSRSREFLSAQTCLLHPRAHAEGKGNCDILGLLLLRPCLLLQWEWFWIW